MTAKQCATVAMALLLVSACSSSGRRAEPTAGDSGGYSASVARAAKQYSTDHLTGFGATRAAWDQHHSPSTDPKLAPGCCYGPDVSAPDNGGEASTWNASASGDVIDILTHNFRPHTNEATALNAVQGQDLPVDASQVQDQVEDTCHLIVFSSSAMRGADPSLGSQVTVELSSPIDLATGDPSPYDASNVTSAVETADGDISGGC